MTILGRHLFYDYPQYYNLFSRITTNAKIAEVANTNRRFLTEYKGADGIKTGYTRAAGFNLVASAERGGERIIATIFGGTSTAQRNARVSELLNMGFDKAPSRVAVRKPAPPVYVAEAASEGPKTIRVAGAVSSSLRPAPRPGSAAAGRPAAAPATAPEQLIASIQDDIEEAVAAAASAIAEELTPVSAAPPAPPARRADYGTVTRDTVVAAAEPEVVSRVSTSGGRHWGINVGRFSSRFAAERMLLKTALAEMSTLDGALRKVAQRGGGFDANFVGMSEDQAGLACRRLAARGVGCTTLGPG
jgi:D-alanyl-D-alanine carboxypeptidase